MNDILKYEPDFSESMFKTFVDNVFIQIHLALMTESLEKVQHFMSNNVFEKYRNKLQSLQDRKVRQIYDEINVKETNILSMDVVDDYLVIKVDLISRYMDYLVDLEGNYVSGVNTHRIERHNDLTFVKRIDAKQQGTVRRCPSCGFSMDINSNGQCKYCHTIYNQDEKGWILTDIVTR